jgi:hypothetical protein
MAQACGNSAFNRGRRRWSIASRESESMLYRKVYFAGSQSFYLTLFKLDGLTPHTIGLIDNAPLRVLGSMSTRDWDKLARAAMGKVGSATSQLYGWSYEQQTAFMKWTIPGIVAESAGIPVRMSTGARNLLDRRSRRLLHESSDEPIIESASRIVRMIARDAQRASRTYG